MRYLSFVYYGYNLLLKVCAWGAAPLRVLLVHDL